MSSVSQHCSEIYLMRASNLRLIIIRRRRCCYAENINVCCRSGDLWDPDKRRHKRPPAEVFGKNSDAKDALIHVSKAKEKRSLTPLSASRSSRNDKQTIHHQKEREISKESFRACRSAKKESALSGEIKE